MNTTYLLVALVVNTIFFVETLALGLIIIITGRNLSWAEAFWLCATNAIFILVVGTYLSNGIYP